MNVRIAFKEKSGMSIGFKLRYSKLIIQLFAFYRKLVHINVYK